MPRRAAPEPPSYEELVIYLESLQATVRELDDEISETLEAIESYHATAHPSVLGRIARWWRERNNKPSPRKLNPSRFKDIKYAESLRLRDRSAARNSQLFLPKGRSER